MSGRIKPNGALCDRCDTNITQYQFNPLGATEYVCPQCMTAEERSLFQSLNEPEAI